jgi:peptide/nickel transport system permease protein
MARYLVARLGASILILLAVTLLVFVAFDTVPRAPSRNATPYNDPYRLHGSMGHQYGVYIWNLVRRGDLGNSYIDREAVTARLFRAGPVTLSLVAGGLIVWLLVSIPLGVIAALRPRSLLDRAAAVFVLIGVSLHPLWLGLVAGHILGDDWHLFPATGYCDLFSPSTSCGGTAQWGYHLLLPWLVFGLLNAALYTLMIRAFVREEISQDYVRTARAKGADERRVVRAHVFANLLPPFVTMIGMSTGIALGGVVFVETAFGLPGLGGLLRRSIQVHDVPLTAGIVLFVTAVIVFLNLLVDVAYVLLDPRLRRQKTPAGGVITV